MYPSSIILKMKVQDNKKDLQIIRPKQKSIKDRHNTKFTIPTRLSHIKPIQEAKSEIKRILQQSQPILDIHTINNHPTLLSIFGTKDPLVQTNDSIESKNNKVLSKEPNQHFLQRGRERKKYSFKNNVFNKPILNKNDMNETLRSQIQTQIPADLQQMVDLSQNSISNRENPFRRQSSFSSISRANVNVSYTQPNYLQFLDQNSFLQIVQEDDKEQNYW